MTKTTRITTGKVKRTMTASVAAIMIAATAASIGASAANEYRCAGAAPYLFTTTTEPKTAEEFVKAQLKNEICKGVLDAWQKAQKGADNIFPQGCDIDGGGVETEQEKTK